MLFRCQQRVLIYILKFHFVLKPLDLHVMFIKYDSEGSYMGTVQRAGFLDNVDKLTLNNTKSHFHLDLLAIKRDITELWEFD